MAMILIGQYDSPFVRRVGVTLHHYGIPFGRRVLSVFDDFETVRAMNPLGQVPTLELDDGERLFDSRMILDFVDGLVSPEQCLTPSREPDRHRVLRVEAVALGLAEKAVQWRTELHRRSPDRRDPAWARRLEEQVVSALEWLEDRQPSPWFHGPRMTRADVLGAIVITYLRNKHAQFMHARAFPALEALCARCEALPEFEAAPYPGAEGQAGGADHPGLTK
jgi:glutathione S-transferase